MISEFHSDLAGVHDLELGNIAVGKLEEFRHAIRQHIPVQRTASGRDIGVIFRNGNTVYARGPKLFKSRCCAFYAGWMAGDPGSRSGWVANVERQLDRQSGLVNGFDVSFEMLEKIVIFCTGETCVESAVSYVPANQLGRINTAKNEALKKGWELKPGKPLCSNCVYSRDYDE